MTNETAREILKIMTKGIDPITGEILPDDHLCNYPEVARALCLAIQSLSADSPINALPANKKNGKLNAGRPWTKEDILELEQLYRTGASMAKICQQLQRRSRGVQKQLEYLGLNHTAASSTTKSPRNAERAGQRWPREEDILLNDLYIEKWSIPEIASEMHRSEYSIFCRMEKLELYGEEYGYPAKASTQWSRDDIATLREMFLSGKTVEDISLQMGRNKKSISARLFYLGLVKESPVNIFHQRHTDK